MDSYALLLKTNDFFHVIYFSDEISTDLKKNFIFKKSLIHKNKI